MKYFIETHGCQMNESDTEIIKSLLENNGYTETNNFREADLICVNSCSVRLKAEERAIHKLFQYSSVKKTNPHAKIGLIGCTAQQKKENIKTEIPSIDFVLGPDSYHDIIPLIKNNTNQFYVGCNFSEKEMYEDISPSYMNQYFGYIPITRGCNNFCSYCIVPFTRGRERSMKFDRVIELAHEIINSGRTEIILLGQNVNSYYHEGKYFHDILDTIANIEGLRRIRFTSPHPKDLTDETISVMTKYDNICNHLHLPLQAGSTEILKKMNRTYTKEQYIDLVEKIKAKIPDIALTTDIIVGFPGETVKNFADTLDVMDKVIYDAAFMFKYSPREGTRAAKEIDNIPNEEKTRRLELVIAKQKKHTLMKNKQSIGKTLEVFVEGESKKNPSEKIGRTDSNKIVVIKQGNPEIGHYIPVKITDIAGVSMFGIPEKGELK
ncbi:MAG: tRNA (N6-isopentenyl adenosine(37)-C2)-methylthiotransferase MiaB [Candidatus Marinimicrobia bacterium]|nr:tRNA (N6-isopentenyl adenosine(37)-C2)-methylthiotransferase MiaB [Candidatus Neomarinimicrobiota bacterium]